MKTGLLVLALALVLQYSTAFAPAFVHTSVNALYMSELNEDEKVAAPVAVGEEGEIAGGLFTPKQFRDENTQWVDDRAEANVSSAALSPWAAALVAYPVTLLLNDFFHFLPGSNAGGN